MSFKIWGKEGILSEPELIEKLNSMGVPDAYVLLKEIVKKGFAAVGNTKIFVLR